MGKDLAFSRCAFVTSLRLELSGTIATGKFDISLSKRVLVSRPESAT